MSQKVSRSNLKVTHQYLKDNPATALVVAILAFAIVIALHFDLVSHSANIINWKLKQEIGEFLFCLIGVICLCYFLISRFKR